MACSKYEYVKKFEQHFQLLPNTWTVIRLDGHGFHRFSKEHNFAKPNDMRALRLMNACAEAVLRNWHDVVLAYGQSDEFSFVVHPSASIFQRREAKIITNMCSLFTSVFVMRWNEFFHEKLKYPPSFDARAVSYPTTNNLRDYLSWRQVDCHINNLYNTAFWALVQNSSSPKTEREAQDLLRPTDSAAKNELLFSQFDINYNNIDPVYRKGSVLFWKRIEQKEMRGSGETIKMRPHLCVEHVDIIGDSFWNENPYILSRS